ncbi:MAG: IS5/IS1182 family transposase, partial [Candidatus Sumerlaeia bacterium]|nr:IS5/IS1182 family transposase [Candidatus Sumerlaeia bacterium]
ERHRAELRLLGVEPHLRRRGEAGSEPLGHNRWPVERTSAHLKKNRRLRTRYDRSHHIHQGFLTLGCIKLAFRRWERLC